MTCVRVSLLPAVPPTRGPGLRDTDLWAIKDIQASLSLEKGEQRAAVPKSHGVSRATCAHFSTVLGEAAWLHWLPSPLGMDTWAFPSPVHGTPCSMGILDLNLTETPTAVLCSGPEVGMTPGMLQDPGTAGCRAPSCCHTAITAPTRFPLLGKGCPGLRALPAPRPGWLQSVPAGASLCPILGSRVPVVSTRMGTLRGSGNSDMMVRWPSTIH